MIEREDRIVWVSPSYGAYLIHFTGTQWEDLTPTEQFDAASSVVVAKRLARSGALEGGYSAPFRWERIHGGWALSGMIDPEAVRRDIARAHAAAYGYPDPDVELEDDELEDDDELE